MTLCPRLRRKVWFVSWMPLCGTYAMDELIDSLYALKFDSLTYENKAEVIGLYQGSC